MTLMTLTLSTQKEGNGKELKNALTTTATLKRATPSSIFYPRLSKD